MVGHDAVKVKAHPKTAGVEHPKKKSKAKPAALKTRGQAPRVSQKKASPSASSPVPLAAALLAGFAEEFWRGQPNELPAGRNQTLQFDQGYTCLLQSSEVMLCAERGGKDVVKLGSVAKEEDRRQLLVFG
jgi:hypothetical protein